MTPLLTKELSEALHANRDGLLNVIDPVTNRTYVLVDAATFAELERQQTHQAIQSGLESMEAGGGISLAEADAQLRKELGFPPRQPTSPTAYWDTRRASRTKMRDAPAGV